VSLVSTGCEIRALGVEDAALDVTLLLKIASKSLLECLPEVTDFILKARSPSCGYRTTPIHDATSGEEINGSGLFAAQVTQMFPDLPIWDEKSYIP
jgi:uncharacterized protein YbbK (DUF523 family)